MCEREPVDDPTLPEDSEPRGGVIKKGKETKQLQTTLKNQVCAEKQPGEERIPGQKASEQR